MSTFFLALTHLLYLSKPPDNDDDNDADDQPEAVADDKSHPQEK